MDFLKPTIGNQVKHILIILSLFLFSLTIISCAKKSSSSSSDTTTQMGGSIQGVELSLSTVVTTLAGTGSSGSVNGTGTSASFYNPQGITTDGTNLYVTEYNNQLSIISSQLDKQISLKESLELGIDEIAIENLIRKLVLQIEINKLGIDISEEFVADQIINDDNFKKKVAKGFVLIKFTAPYQFATLDDRKLFAGVKGFEGCVIYKIDHSQVKKVVKKLRIRNYPSIAIFHNGKKLEVWKADMDGKVDVTNKDIKKAISGVMAGDVF